MGALRRAGLRGARALALLPYLCAAAAPAFVPAQAAAQAVVAQPAPASTSPEPAAAPSAVVVLIGDAARSPELREVIEELLARQSVEPSFEERPEFEPELWLDQNLDDPRSFAFVTVPDPTFAELYLRGPRGRRFLRRVLELRSGLDEVGRELIAGVVETSIASLLHSDEGLSREQARAELAQHPATPAPVPAAEPAAPPASTPAERPSPWSTLFGVRVLGAYSGSDLGALAAFGLEGALAWHEPDAPRLRVRLNVEASLPQSIDGGGVEANLVSVPVRIGVDVGTAFELYFGAALGFDLVHLAPERTRNAYAALTPADSSLELIPSARFELRYDLHLGAHAVLGFALLADWAFRVTDYDMVQAGERTTLATPLRVRAGAAVTIGWAP